MKLPTFEDHEIHKQRFGSEYYRSIYKSGFENAMNIARDQYRAHCREGERLNRILARGSYRRWLGR